MVNQIRLKIKDFRAIKDADIILDGITLVAGENGCGKSTLSKFLYYVFKTSNQYEELLDEELRNHMGRYYSFLSRLEKDILRSEQYFLEDGVVAKGSITIYSLDDILFDEAYRLDLIDRLSDRLGQLKLSLGDNLSRERFRRNVHILADLLEVEVNGTDIEVYLNLLKDRISSVCNDYKLKKEKRSSQLFFKSLSKVFDYAELPSYYSILEYNTPIISNDLNTITEAYSVQNVAYIDTPMLLGTDPQPHDYWHDTNRILQGKGVADESHINSIISSEIIKGDAFIEDRQIYDQRFIYKREDGSEFNLLDCATGIKSFAMLQMMLKNGFLNKYTLLIIDEPESHLHPQWIVEYARLIVLLNKHIGVKFFLASHNPDMVSAIKYISEEEKVDAKLNFYLAERDGLSYTYSYKHLKTDIDPIFGSFNIALDRISQYGIKEDDCDV